MTPRVRAAGTPLLLCLNEIRELVFICEPAAPAPVVSCVASPPEKPQGALPESTCFVQTGCVRELAATPFSRTLSASSGRPVADIAAGGAAGVAVLCVTAAEGIFGGQSLSPRSPPRAFIINPGTQVGVAKVEQRTGLAASGARSSQVENLHLHPHFLPFFHHPGENCPH